MPETKFASIKPRFLGDDVRRAPIVPDIHRCKGGFLRYLNMSKDGLGNRWTTQDIARAVGCVDFSNYVFDYCPYCGMLLPTDKKHAGIVGRGFSACFSLPQLGPVFLVVARIIFYTIILIAALYLKHKAGCY